VVAAGILTPRKKVKGKGTKDHLLRRFGLGTLVVEVLLAGAFLGLNLSPSREIAVAGPPDPSIEVFGIYRWGWPLPFKWVITCHSRTMDWDHREIIRRLGSLYKGGEHFDGATFDSVFPEYSMAVWLDSQEKAHDLIWQKGTWEVPWVWVDVAVLLLFLGGGWCVGEVAIPWARTRSARNHKPRDGAGERR
jgi:hypothetical protein